MTLIKNCKKVIKINLSTVLTFPEPTFPTTPRASPYIQ